jgi:hypothetical protein
MVIRILSYLVFWYADYVSRILMTLFFIGPLHLNHFCAAQTESKPLTIGKTEVFHSRVLQEDRIINIYFREKYTTNDTIKYPVIYVLDGGVGEDQHT